MEKGDTWLWKPSIASFFPCCTPVRHLPYVNSCSHTVLLETTLRNVPFFFAYASVHVLCVGVSVTIVGLDADRLVVIAKILSEQCQTAAVRGVSGNGEGEFDGAVVVDVEILYRRFGDPQRSVDEGPLGVDNQRLQQSVLIQQLRPPVGGNNASSGAVVAGADPFSQWNAIDGKVDVAGIVFVELRAFRGDLEGDIQLL